MLPITNNEIAQTIMKSFLMQYGRIGCTNEIFPEPVHLVHPLKDFRLSNNLDVPPPSPPTPYQYNNKHMRFMRMYFGKSEMKNWTEQSIRALSVFGFMNDLWTREIFGNCNGIIHQFCVDRQQTSPLCSLLKAHSPENEIGMYEDDIFQHYAADPSLILRLFDFYPTPPFFENSSALESYDRDPLIAFHEVLSNIPTNAIGGMQVLIESVPRQNEMRDVILRLTALHHELALMVSPREFDPDWAFSTHSDNHRPSNNPKLDPAQNLFAYRLRLFLFAKKNDAAELSRCLTASMQTFSSGRRRFNILTEQEYEKAFAGDIYKIRQMICARISYTTGCITSQSELAALCHFPTE